MTRQAITYQLQRNLNLRVSLCKSCRDTYHRDHDLLGPVSHGLHSEPCDLCDYDSEEDDAE